LLFSAKDLAANDAEKLDALSDQAIRMFSDFAADAGRVRAQRPGTYSFFGCLRRQALRQSGCQKVGRLPVAM
jgi:hypothetical protein